MSEPILISGQVELQTLVLGWHMYDQLWKILQDTGLAFLPFLAMILNNFIEPIKTAYTTSAAQLSLKRVEWDLIRMLIVIVLAGQPFIDISLENYGLLELCKKDGTDDFIALKKLREDAAKITAAEQVAPISPIWNEDEKKKATVPLWWYAVMSVSTGFTEAAKASVPCVNDFREILANTIAGGVISGTDSINAEILSFIKDCYRPAKAEYDKFDPTFKTTKVGPLKTNATTLINAIEKANASYPKDVSHVGSMFFLGLGVRKGDSSGSGWESKGAAEQNGASIAGEEKFYDKLIQIPNWNGDGTTRFVSCRQWWGQGGSALSNFEILAETKPFFHVANYMRGSKDNRFMTTTGDWDGIPEDWEKTAAPFRVMRQLSFRIFVLLATSRHVVHYRSKPEDDKGPGIYISPGNYAGLSLDSVLEAESKYKPVRYVVRRILDGETTGKYEIDSLYNKYHKNQHEGAIVIRNLIQTYIEDHVMKGSVIGETPGASATEYAEKIKKGAASFGLAVAALGTYVTAYIARTSFPYIQALMLCGLYIFLAVGLVFAGYTLEFMYAGAMAIFTLKFMAFIFYLCAWLDNNLIVLVTGKTIEAAIWSSTPVGGGAIVTGLSGILLGPIGFAAGAIGTALKGVYDNYELVTIDYATAGLYFTLPSLFATVMAWAGVRGAETIGEMQKAAQPLVSAGQQGAQMAQKMAGGAVSTAGGILSGKAGVLGGGVVGGIASKIAGRSGMTGK